MFPLRSLWKYQKVSIFTNPFLENLTPLNLCDFHVFLVL